MRDEIVTHYHRPIAKAGETHGRDVELDMAPLHTEQDYIQQIIPAVGYLAVFRYKDEPELCIEPVIAWGVVLRYESENFGATEYREVLPLVLENETLVPQRESGSAQLDIVREGDEGRLEILRQIAKREAEGGK